MGYSKERHTTFHYRITWSQKYQLKVLQGRGSAALTRDYRQLYADMGVDIINGTPSRNHVHTSVEILLHISVKGFAQRVEERLSSTIHQEFEHIRKRFSGQCFRTREFLPAIFGIFTDDIVNRYLDRHATMTASASSFAPTGISGRVAW